MNDGLGSGPSLLLEFLGERNIIEEDVGIVELAVPGALEVAHGLEQVVEFLIAHQRDQGGIGARRCCAIGRIIMFVGSP